jgi:hypothetical protein
LGGQKSLLQQARLQVLDMKPVSAALLARQADPPRHHQSIDIRAGVVGIGLARHVAVLGDEIIVAAPAG